MAEIDITATRMGLTNSQKHRLMYHLLPADTVRHGVCIGGDAQCHWLARAMGVRRIIGHPCTLHDYFDTLVGGNVDILLPEKPPLVRNRDIVNASSMVVAFPSSEREQVRRSGTWATIRYAKKVGKSLVIVYPDGREEYHGIPR